MSRFSLIIVSLFLSLSFFACVSSKKSTTDGIKTAEVKELKYRQVENIDKAIEHFIAGQVYELKGDYASAILEYQDALRYQQSPGIYNAIARAYQKIGKHSLAVQMALEAIRLDSLNITYRETLADIYVETFEVKKAIGEFEKILKIDSLNYNALFNLAHLYENDKPLRSLELYNKIIKNYGPEWNTLQRIAEISFRLGKFSESAQALEMMIEIDPSNYDLRKLTAETYINAGEIGKAKSILSELVEMRPSDLFAKLRYAEVLLDLKEKGRAIEILNEIIADDSAGIDIKLQVGESLLRNASKDSSYIEIAEGIFKKISQAHPNDWRAHWFLGIIASDKKDAETSFEEFKKVVLLNSQTVEAWRGIGIALYDMGRFEELIEWMNKGIDKFPDDFILNFLLGLGYHRLDRNNEAVTPLEKALSLDPKNIDVISTLALVYDAIGLTVKSDSLHELGLKISPNNHLILNNYSYTLAERGEKLELALEMAKKAIEQEPENPAYLDTIGWIYFKLGDYEKAKYYIQMAVEKGGSPVVIEHLGDVYFKLGNIDKAIEYWKKALEKNPSNEKLKEKIKGGKI
ncbi:Tfp pilus assembly protein PilF [Candidatus Thermokryptus mobilis]|uniref:Tfp pilus assembly protein PilF n=1 Tax=Candidatus Thermokryptus mobilis TaxID=1643428 RepID=A0A0S4N2V6_9BACT|nr:tetratricopeptide repeat protein [Candidatus Thermokryptus mobilis]CUU05626.1 Tfp pilus assembly protein PilF [Candidatus Thermokryptus mobilis]